MNTITVHKKTDFGDVWNWYAKDNSFRFSIYCYEDDPDTIYLSNVFVQKEYRGLGYGNNILDMAESIAKEFEASTIRLKAKKNSTARKWYERHGYSYLSDDKENPRNVWMEKKITQ